MASKARSAYDKNKTDIGHLIDMYRTVEILYKEDGTVLQKGYDVAMRSALVLLVTYWEAYIEDICDEALTHIVTNLTNPDPLPKAIKQHIAKELKGNKHELEIWKLAGDGWKTCIIKRLSSLKSSRNRNFNSPKTGLTNEFVNNTVGIENISSSWKLEDVENVQVCTTLDNIVRIRGAIAHRGTISQKITIGFVEECSRFFDKIVSQTGGKINSHCTSVTGKPLWEQQVKKAAPRKKLKGQIKLS